MAVPKKNTTKSAGVNSVVKKKTPARSSSNPKSSTAKKTTDNKTVAKMDLLNYDEILKKVDVVSSESPVRYCKSIISLTGLLLEKVGELEESAKTNVKYSALPEDYLLDYEQNDSLSERENKLLHDRHLFVKNIFDFGFGSIKEQLYKIRLQAENTLQQLKRALLCDYSLNILSEAEQHNKCSIPFIAEILIDNINDTIIRINKFTDKKAYYNTSCEIIRAWDKEYKQFITKKRKMLLAQGKQDSVEVSIIEQWFDEWKNLRLLTEEMMLKLLEKGNLTDFHLLKNGKTFVVEQIISELSVYRNNIDTFYIEERKSIYQSHCFESSGEWLDSLESGSKIRTITNNFQNAIQEILVNCKNEEDKYFILQWMSDISDIHVDDIICEIKKDETKMFEDIYTELLKLKEKNYQIFLNDAKAYALEQSKRDKQYNSILFRMKKTLIDKR